MNLLFLKSNNTSQFHEYISIIYRFIPMTSEASALSIPSPAPDANPCLYLGNGNGNGPPEDKVRNFITELLDSLIGDLTRADGCPSITLKRRSNHANFSLNPETRALQCDTTEPSRTYSWPGKTVQEGWRFGRLRPSPDSWFYFTYSWFLIDLIPFLSSSHPLTNPRSYIRGHPWRLH